MQDGTASSACEGLPNRFQFFRIAFSDQFSTFIRRSFGSPDLRCGRPRKTMYGRPTIPSVPRPRRFSDFGEATPLSMIDREKPRRLRPPSSPTIRYLSSRAARASNFDRSVVTIQGRDPETTPPG